MQVRSFDTGEIHEEGRVVDLCSPSLTVVARELGISAADLRERLKAAWDRAGVYVPPVKLPTYARAEIETVKTAAFTMNHRGGLHARPAVLLQKALAPLEFAYVEARHEGNGRTVRAKTNARAKPAFWLQLLSLEAYRSAIVSFTVAGTEEEVTHALDAICGVLGRPMPERFDYWRELGVDLYCKLYFQDVSTRGARRLLKRYRLFNKSDLDRDKSPEDPMRTPMASVARFPTDSTH